MKVANPPSPSLKGGGGVGGRHSPPVGAANKFYCFSTELNHCLAVLFTYTLTQYQCKVADIRNCLKSSKSALTRSTKLRQIVCVGPLS